MAPKRTQKEQPDLELVAREPGQIGNALHRFRKSADQTQSELSERAGVKQPIISQVELGAIGTRLETLFKILAALDLELVVRRRRKTLPKADD
jgi:HTH-type transcriptional regulator/antitoxin HipB